MLGTKTLCWKDVAVSSVKWSFFIFSLHKSNDSSHYQKTSTSIQTKTSRNRSRLTAPSKMSSESFYSSSDRFFLQQSSDFKKCSFDYKTQPSAVSLSFPVSHSVSGCLFSRWEPLQKGSLSSRCQSTGGKHVFQISVCVSLSLRFPLSAFLFLSDSHSLFCESIQR